MLRSQRTHQKMEKCHPVATAILRIRFCCQKLRDLLSIGKVTVICKLIIKGCLCLRVITSGDCLYLLSAVTVRNLKHALS